MISFESTLLVGRFFFRVSAIVVLNIFGIVGTAAKLRVQPLEIIMRGIQNHNARVIIIINPLEAIPSNLSPGWTSHCSLRPRINGLDDVGRAPSSQFTRKHCQIVPFLVVGDRQVAGAQLAADLLDLQLNCVISCVSMDKRWIREKRKRGTRRAPALDISVDGWAVFVLVCRCFFLSVNVCRVFASRQYQPVVVRFILTCASLKLGMYIH